jgi:hypothetical protein
LQKQVISKASSHAESQEFAGIRISSSRIIGIRISSSRKDESMCKKLKPHTVHEPKPLRSSNRRLPRSSDEINKTPSKSTDISGTSSLFSKVSTSSANSLASLRDSLPENPNIYRYKELADATAQFSSGRMGKSSVWKCVLRGKTVAATVRSQKRKIRDFSSGLREICNAHHASIVKLLGGCCEGDHLYLVYEYVQGSSLADCLRGSKVPGFTVLSSWLSRMQIAVDVAQGLEYMHHDSKLDYIHNYIKSSSILITEPGYKARICHLGACYLAGEYVAGEVFEQDSNSEIQPAGLHRRSRSMKITGTHGYMAPEYVAGGGVSHKTDVFAFGVVLLELLSGHEPVRYVSEDGGRRQKRVGLIESLNDILSAGGNNCTGMLRSWIDPRLRDSFPVDCAERVARIASACVDPDSVQRPDMRYVAGELSKVFIMSEQWSERMEANKGWVSSTFEAR